MVQAAAVNDRACGAGEIRRAARTLFDTDPPRGRTRRSGGSRVKAEPARSDPAEGAVG